MLAMIIGYILMAISSIFKLNPNTPKIDWEGARWIIPYLVGMGAISFFGTFGPGGIIGGVGPFKKVWVGGDGRLEFWWDLLVLGIFSLMIYYGAIASRLSSAKVDEYVKDVFPPTEVMH